MNSSSATYSFAAIQTINFIGEGGSDMTTLYLPANCTVNMSPDSGDGHRFGGLNRLLRFRSMLRR